MLWPYIKPSWQLEFLAVNLFAFHAAAEEGLIEYSSKCMWLLELFYHLSVDQKHKYWIWQVLEGHKCYNFTISGWQESCTCIFNLPGVCNPLMILRLYDFFLHLFSINCMLPVQSDIAYELDFCSSAMRLWHTTGLWFMKICIYFFV